VIKVILHAHFVVMVVGLVANVIAFALPHALASLGT
jgi:hypothetical protein